jgi:hypothetical protein
VNPKEPFHIAINWYISDVKQVRPDLTNDQAQAVLQCIRDNHDANEGVNWDVIEHTAQDMYPTPPRLRYKA